MNMKVCFIGSCGHWEHALTCLKGKDGVAFSGFAPRSAEEELRASIAENIPFFDDYRVMLDQTVPDLVVLSPIFGLTVRRLLVKAGTAVLLRL